MDAETVQAIIDELQEQKQQKDDLRKLITFHEAEIVNVKEELNAAKEEARLAKESAFRLLTENEALRTNRITYTARELVVMKKALDLTPRMVKLVLQNQGVGSPFGPTTGKDVGDYEHFVEVVRHALDDSGV